MWFAYSSLGIAYGSLTGSSMLLERRTPVDCSKHIWVPNDHPRTEALPDLAMRARLLDS